MRAVFSKKGDMRFVSHLDMVRMFHRASRRALLPVAMTKGFSPRLKANITRALKLGVESDSEEIVFHMERRISCEELIEAINRKLPEGVRCLRAEEII